MSPPIRFASVMRNPDPQLFFPPPLQILVPHAAPVWRSEACGPRLPRTTSALGDPGSQPVASRVDGEDAAMSAVRAKIAPGPRHG